jgi:hypothetical protein
MTRNGKIARLPLAVIQQLRACLKNTRGSAARDFGRSRGGEAGESPQRALTAEPTTAAAKRPAVEPLIFFRQPLSRNHAVALGSAVVPTAVFGVPPKTFSAYEHLLKGEGALIIRLAGGTPARATGTLALTIPSAWFRLGHQPRFNTHLTWRQASWRIVTTR